MTYANTRCIKCGLVLNKVPRCFTRRGRWEPPLRPVTWPTPRCSSGLSVPSLVPSPGTGLGLAVVVIVLHQQRKCPAKPTQHRNYFESRGTARYRCYALPLTYADDLVVPTAPSASTAAADWWRLGDSAAAAAFCRVCCTLMMMTRPGMKSGGLINPGKSRKRTWKTDDVSRRDQLVMEHLPVTCVRRMHSTNTNWP